VVAGVDALWPEGMGDRPPATAEEVARKERDVASA